MKIPIKQGSAQRLGLRIPRRWVVSHDFYDGEWSIRYGTETVIRHYTFNGQYAMSRYK